MNHAILSGAKDALQNQYEQHLEIIEGGFEGLMKAEAKATEQRMKGYEALRAQQLKALNEQFGVEADKED